MPTLMVQLPGGAPVSHVLRDETSTVGRMKGNTIVIEDASISLMHARIIRRNGEFFLKDLNSTNGTMVNGQPISEVKLRDNDRIRFAEITTQFQLDNPAAQTSSETLTAAPAISSPGSPGSPPSAPRPAPAPVPVPTATAVVIPPKPGNAVSIPVAPPPATQTMAARPPAPIPPARRSGSRKKKNLAVPLALAACLVLGLGGYVAYVQFFPGASKVAARTAPQESLRATPATKPAVPLAGKPAVAAPASTERAADLPAMVKGLKNADVAERRKAVTALHGLGPEAKEATDQLKDALKDSDSEVQMWAALTLSKNQVYDKAEVPILVRGLQHENPVLRQVVCLSMGLLPFEAAEKDMVIPALAEAVRKDTDEDVRAAAQSALSVIAPELVQNNPGPASSGSTP